jgi:DMSO reductase family type II enzyme chaperone
MTIASMTFEHDAEELIPGARSHVYRMLATAFSYPSDQQCEDIASGEWSGTLTRFASHLPFRLPIPQETPSGAADRKTLQEGYVSIFEVGTGRPYCPLYEGSHRRGRMKLMEELVRFYEHFGLKIQPGDHPDHLSAELEFMHYMTFKEAAVIAHRDSADDLRRAQHDFLDRHLCKWLPRMRERLLSASGLPQFYSLAADLADDFCKRDLAWLKAGGEMPHP